MIDTIHINLHNLQKNVDVYNWIVRDGNNGVIKYNIDRSEVGGLLRREVKVYPEAEKAVEMLRVHTRYEPSSHYSIIVEVHPKRDLIKFSFSVPKYFYGHNIAQACENTNERDFTFIKGFTDTFEHQIEKSFERIKTYIKSFFYTEFAGIDVDMCDVEIVRLDMCYNQFFNSKKDALFYLDMQKKIQKKYARRNEQKVTNYTTSIFFYSRDYSVKIYHKGAEYEKNDSKEHERANQKHFKKHGINLYNIEYLQETADKILRYEITFRKDYLNYIFNNKIFRKKSKKYQEFKKLYNALHSLHTMSKNEAKNRLLHNVSEKIKIKYNPADWETIKPIFEEFKDVIITDKMSHEPKSIIEYVVEYYQKKQPKEITHFMIVSALNKFYNDFGALLSKGRKIFLKLNRYDKEQFKIDNETNKNFLHSVDYIEFNKELCTELGNRLKDFCKDFKVNQRDNLSTALRKIDEHNEQIDIINKNKKNALPLSAQKVFKSKKKIDKNRMSFILLCLENTPLHELRDTLNLDEKTFYRLKKDLAEIGVDKNSLNNITPVVTKLDFSDYYTETSLNSRNFFVTNASTRLFSKNDYKFLSLIP